MLKTKNEMRRKIPILRIKMDIGADYSQITEVPEIRKIVMEETVYAIKEGIEKKKDSISLFEIYNTNYLIELSKKEWKSSLETALEYFLENEEYDRCAEARDLLNKL
jgi:hypothetical protein